MDTELIEKLAERIDALVADRARLREELEKLREEETLRGHDLESELAEARAEAEAARADLEAVRREAQEREGRIQAATARVQSLIERLSQD
jgi:FtsZ-binding cell division protein ZapB